MSESYDRVWLAKLKEQTLPVDLRCLPLHDIFHAQAVRTPSAVAAVDDTRSLTYSELNLRVLALGEHLRVNFNVGPDAPVGIYLEPSVNYVISFLASMSAGGCFVTIENAYPLSMMKAVCRDTRLGVILTNRTLAPKLLGLDIPVFIVDDNEDTVMALLEGSTTGIAELEQKRLSAPRPTLDNLSFMVYSSGTTGKPKGIANPHRAAVLSYQWRWGLSSTGEGDRVATNVFFIWEAIRPLLVGAATYCLRPDQIYDGPLLASFIERHKITEILFTPTLLRNVLAGLTRIELVEKLKSLKTIFLNGEVLSKELARKALDVLPGIRKINLYSISECHEVAATDLSLLDLGKSAREVCPVGFPSPLTPTYILNPDLSKVDEGQPGELFVGGPLLAREYLNMPAATSERFPPSPFVEDLVEGGDTRMYRTGDMARMLPNGMLEILGRCKFMVKVRGYSIVLDAVEHALLDVVHLDACAVIADGHEGTEKRLVAFIVRGKPLSSGDPTPCDEDGVPKETVFTTDPVTGICSQIQQRLATRLPHYMVPAVFLEIDHFPINPISGKRDQVQLTEMAVVQRKLLTSTRPQQRDTAPFAREVRKGAYKFMVVPRGTSEDEVESAMLFAWEGVLELPCGSVSRDSEFTSLGGHSLSAARLAGAVDAMFGVRLPVIMLLEGITVKSHAQAILGAWQQQHAPPTAAVTTPITPKTGAAALLARVHASAHLPSSVLHMLTLANKQSVTTGPSVPPLRECKQVFLTGATGFFGAFLLSELLQSGHGRVVCLVRPREGKSGLEIVKANLQLYGLLLPLGDERLARVQVVAGDTGSEGLGVDATAYALLLQSDGIVHCAAAVSLVESFDSLSRSNVTGTKEILKLAVAIKGAQGVSPRGVFISTNGIFPLEPYSAATPPVAVADTAFDTLPARVVFGPGGTPTDADTISPLCNGYALSKWSAEKIVTDVSNSLGLTFSTFRMGNLGWDSRNGQYNDLDFQGMIFRGCNKVGAAPDVPEWRIELTPVDWAASIVVQLACDATHQTGTRIFHVVQPRQIPWPDVMAWMNEVRAEQKRPPLDLVSWEAWRGLIQRSAQTSASSGRLLGLLDMLPGTGTEYLTCQPSLACSSECRTHPDDTYLTCASIKLFFNRCALRRCTAAVKAEAVGSVSAQTTAAIMRGHAQPRPLEGKLAIVTGASSGIGRAIAVALAQAGCNVSLAARRAEALEQTKSEIASACTNGTVHTLCVPTDVTDRASVEQCVAVTEDSLGPVDILVNNAGVMYFTPMKNVAWDDWERTVDVNCKGTMHGVGAVLPQMLGRGAGHIINITSDAGRQAFPGLGVYSGSKMFVEGMSKALRLETAGTGLRVTCIQPGNVATPLLSTSSDAEGLALYGTPSGAKVLEPADVGRAVVYAATQPEWCAVNEILVEPREEPI